MKNNLASSFPDAEVRLEIIVSNPPTQKTERAMKPSPSFSLPLAPQPAAAKASTERSPAQKAVAQIEKLEQRAKELQMKLWDTEEKWKKQMAKAKGTPEWTIRCDSTGSVESYSFGDVLS